MASSEDDASMEENFSLSTNFPDLMMSLLSRKLKKYEYIPEEGLC